MLDLDFLRLGQTESAGDVRDWLLRKHDRSRTNGANDARKLNVFDGFGETLQSAAILLQKAQPRPIDLAVNQQAHQSFMSKHRREWQLALSTVKAGRHFAERLAAPTRPLLARRLPQRR